MDQLQIFAHRGLSSQAPENTMSAFAAAAATGAKWVETDVDILDDGTVILIHDNTLDRTTDAEGSYYQMPIEKVKQLDAGSWYNSQFAGERIPTLAEFIDWLNKNQMNANIELKSNAVGNKVSLPLIEKVAEHIADLSTGREVRVSSFNHVMLARFKDRCPDVPVSVLYTRESLWPDWPAVAALIGADAIHPEDSALAEADIQAMREAGFKVNVWTVNKTVRATQLASWGANGIFTDIADQMLALQ